MNEPKPTQSRKPAWWPLVLPFAAFMLLTMFEPKFGDGSKDLIIGNPSDEEHLLLLSDELENDQASGWFTSAASKYFALYSFKILVVASILLVLFKRYLLILPFKVSWLGLLVGLVGAVLWIGLCELRLESTLAGWVGLPDSWFASRSGFNPYKHYAWSLPLVMFFAVRFSGLAIIVPIIEELFLRGFFVRYIEDLEWWKVKFNRLGWFPLLVAPLYGVLSHPMSEALAAASWFALVTLLVVKSRNFWDCVLAHAITNLLLGIYVVSYDRWHLW